MQFYKVHQFGKTSPIFAQCGGGGSRRLLWAPSTLYGVYLCIYAFKRLFFQMAARGRHWRLRGARGTFCGLPAPYMGYIYVYMLLKGYFSKWPLGGATGALWGARGAFCGLPAPHMGYIYVYRLSNGYFSKWPLGGATGALWGARGTFCGLPVPYIGYIYVYILCIYY